MMRRLRSGLTRLNGATRGVALTEFALALPLVLLAGLGGIETSNYVLTSMKLAQIAQSVADNAGRYRQALDEGDVNEIMVGAKLMGDKIGLAGNGRIILSDLEQRTNTDGSGGAGPTSPGNPSGFRQWIRWQRCAGALNRPSSYGVPLNASGAPVTDIGAAPSPDHGAVQTASTMDAMGPAGRQIAAVNGTAVMLVEVFYVYQPIIPFYARGSREMHVVEAFAIRQRTDFSVYNGANRTGTARSDCRLFDATVPT